VAPSEVDLLSQQGQTAQGKTPESPWATAENKVQISWLPAMSS